MNDVTMYSQTMCPYCDAAERLLASRGVTRIERIAIDGDLGQRQRMMERTGRRTVPQIFIGDTHVGGFDDLAELDHQGRLMPLLSGDQP